MSNDVTNANGWSVKSQCSQHIVNQNSSLSFSWAWAPATKYLVSFLALYRKVLLYQSEAVKKVKVKVAYCICLIESLKDCYATPANINVLDAEQTLWPYKWIIISEATSSGMSGPSLLPPLPPRWQHTLPSFVCA